MVKKKTDIPIDAAFIISQTSSRNRKLEAYKPPEKKVVGLGDDADKIPGEDIEIDKDSVSGLEKIEPPVRESSKKKTKLSSYEDVFIVKNEIKSRHSVHISREVHGTIISLVRSLIENGYEVSVGGYIDTVLKEHIQTYKNEINEFYNRKKNRLV